MFKQSAQHVASYYARTYPATIPLRPTLQGAHDTDILIVGAGFSGLHTALRLTLAGQRVTLLEASRVAWAASGRNGGQALLGWSCDMPPLERALGLERSRRLWDSMCWAAGELRELPLRHGFDVDYRLGSLWTAVLPRRVKLLEDARREAQEKLDYDCLRLIDREELSEWVDSPRYQAALYDPNGAHLNPLKLAQGLAAVIEAHGGRIYEQSQVMGYQEHADGFAARTDQGEVRSRVMVLACNAYIDRLDRTLSRRLLPVGSYQVATAPLDADFAASLLPRNSCVIDNQFVPDYFRLTPDHRLLFGGGCTYLGGIPKDVAGATRPYLERVFPQLQGVAIEHAWGGHIDCSIQRTPDIGRQGQRYWLQGFSGHGVLPTLAGARAVSDAILGDDDLLKLYQGIDNGRFPGGDLLAAPLEAAAKAWYRMRDHV
ncbi:FAD-binding oxidoreductase [Pseudomonas soli]|uniref:FAD-binding oxidoreductase n=1 Tax=Pseudomonas soli TaxID=1306993 RepID=A0ABU7GW20_9PSED|nr:FAD-binding oxidoreductase [Pseudomonas soli]AIN57876.1 FAD-dependent oxidoreductase [Pseudomonas soli]MDW9405078.1 FAD-dependent oxidoreductase [Pseudomonas soli]MEE1883219.1 FAD-binding oxidoreductase [Pseudomonas soli]NBK40766.1 FAD-binding oxidoreductase [Pseudomonas soli]PYC31043.1 FAD-binding oxidoreductase [Pseudomonas soli]